MGYNIKAVREKKGWSQEKLAKESGVSRSIISGIESGRIKTTTTFTLLRIAEALGTKIDKIFYS